MRFFLLFFCMSPGLQAGAIYKNNGYENLVGVLLLSVIVMITALASGVLGLPDSVRLVTMRLVRFMTGLLVLAFFIQTRGVVMMLSSAAVMFCRCSVVLGRRMFIIGHFKFSLFGRA